MFHYWNMHPLLVYLYQAAMWEVNHRQDLRALTALSARANGRKREQR